jgi:hypothetical protein
MADNVAEFSDKLKNATFAIHHKTCRREKSTLPSMLCTAEETKA